MNKFKKYDSYKDSGLEWLGEIPSEWEVKRFNDLFKVSQGLQIIRSERTDSPKTNSVEYITLPSIKGTIKEYIYKPTKNVLCNKNDFLVVRTGSGVGQIITNVKGAFHNNFFKVGINKKLDRKYIYNLLTAHYVKSLMKIYAGITAIPDLNHSEFYSIELALPPLKTQQKIASYLDTQTQKIDKEIELLEQKSEKYKELKQTLINERVLRGLDEGVKLKDSGIEWIGDIPEGWSIERIGLAFNERRTKVNDTEYPPLSVTRNGIVPQLENVAKTIHNDNRRLVKKGDYVINSRSDRRGSSGIANKDGSVSVINIVLEPKKAFFGKYLHHLFRSFSFIEEYYRNGTGIVYDLWTTKYSLMRTIEFSFPSYEEQQKIATYLDEKTGKIDDINAKIKDKITLLKAFRKTLINDVVTGKVKICD